MTRDIGEFMRILIGIQGHIGERNRRYIHLNYRSTSYYESDLNYLNYSGKNSQCSQSMKHTGYSSSETFKILFFFSFRNFLNVSKVFQFLFFWYFAAFSEHEIHLLGVSKLFLWVSLKKRPWHILKILLFLIFRYSADLRRSRFVDFKLSNNLLINESPVISIFF